MSLAGFDKDFYLAAKLKDIQAKHPDQWKDKTVKDLEKFFNDDHNLTAEQHYIKYGASEGLEPNEFFDTKEYLAAKYNQMVAAGKAKDVAEAKAKFSAAWDGRSAFEHYVKYGAAEGVNASNKFDESAYVDAKVAQMVASGKYPDAASALKAFKASGLSALGHYMLYGKEEGIKYVAVSDEERASVEGKTVALTTEKDSVLPADAKTTSYDDTITGVTSSLSSERTLESTDVIDGGEGKDTLKVTLKSSFSTGFTGEGKMSNVEVLDLSTVEGTSVTRTFSAKGATGIETVKIDAANSAIDVKDLASVAKVELSNQAEGNLNVAYAASALTGDDNIQKLTLNKVGTAGKTEAETKYVNVNIDGVDGSVITSSGESENFVDLTSLAGTSVAVDGDQDINIKAVKTTVKSFDASNAKGDVTAVLSGVSALTSVKGGEGDDKITVTTDSLAVNAALSGGKGADTLVIKGGAKVLQPVMTGFETLEVGAITGDVVVSAKNTSDLANIVVNGATKAFTLVNTTASDLNIVANAASSDAAVTSDNAGATTLEYAKTADLDVTLTKSTDLALNVTGGTATGTVTANNAENFSFKVAEKAAYNGTVNASLIENLVINAEGSVGKAADATFNTIKATSATIKTGAAAQIVLNAPLLESLDIDANGSFTLKSGEEFSKLQVVNIDTEGIFATAKDFAGVSTVKVSGSNAASKATLANLGNSAQEYGIDFSATGLTAGLTTGDIDSGKGNLSVDLDVAGAVTLGALKSDADISIDVADTTGAVELGAIGEAGTDNVSVNADGAMGKVTLGEITADSVDINGLGALKGFANLTVNAGKDITFVGSELAANNLTVKATGTSLTADLKGGIGDDVVNVTSTSSASQTIKVIADLGIGNDSLTIDGSGATGALNIDASGVKASNLTSVIKGGDAADTIKGTDYADTITGGAGDDIITGGAGADKIVIGARTANGMDTVKDFKLGEDKLITTVKGSAVFSTTAVEIQSNNLESTIAKAAEGDGATNSQVKWFNFDGNTYIVFDNTDGNYAAGTDTVVKLAGTIDLSGASLSDFHAAS